MQMCSECGMIYDESEYSKCPNCDIKPMSKENFKKLCQFLWNGYC